MRLRSDALRSMLLVMSTSCLWITIDEHDGRLDGDTEGATDTGPAGPVDVALELEATRPLDACASAPVVPVEGSVAEGSVAGPTSLALELEGYPFVVSVDIATSGVFSTALAVPSSGAEACIAGPTCGLSATIEGDDLSGNTAQLEVPVLESALPDVVSATLEGQLLATRTTGSPTGDLELVLSDARWGAGATDATYQVAICRGGTTPDDAKPDCTPLLLTPDVDGDAATLVAAAAHIASVACGTVPAPVSLWLTVDGHPCGSTVVALSDGELGGWSDDCDGDGAVTGDDCDDLDAARAPGLPEACGDATDPDCSGAAATMVVTDTVGTPGTPYTDLEDAVENAVDASIVEVCGPVSGGIDLPQGVTVIAGSGATPPVWTATTRSHVAFPGTPDTDDTTLSLSHLVLDGEGAAGGVVLDHAGLTLDDVVVTDVVGGSDSPVSVTAGSLRMLGSAVTDSVTTADGGGVRLVASLGYLDVSSSLTGNTASRGGGLALVNSQLELLGSIEGNHATTDGGGAFLDGDASGGPLDVPAGLYGSGTVGTNTADMDGATEVAAGRAGIPFDGFLSVAVDTALLDSQPEILVNAGLLTAGPGATMAGVVRVETDAVLHACDGIGIGDPAPSFRYDTSASLGPPPAPPADSNDCWQVDNPSAYTTGVPCVCPTLYPL